MTEQEQMQDEAMAELESQASDLKVSDEVVIRI